jgi:endoglucanase
MDCLPPDARAARYAALADAVAQLQADPDTAVFVDGGHSRWLSPAELAARLRAVGARGFSLNVSNFFTTAEQQEYGERVSTLLGGVPYVVDTSRNGNGPAPDGPLNWCNPPGRGLGAPPTTATEAPHDVADLWIKGPGQSDGDCGRGDPGSGTWFAAYAAGLVERAQKP